MSELSQLELLMRTRPYVFLTMTLAAGLMYFLLLPEMASSSLHIWFLMVLLIDALRFSIVIIYKKDKHEDRVDEKNVLSLVALSTIIYGFLWGSVGLVFFPDADVNEKMFIFCIVLAVATTATININAIYKSTAAFVLMLLVPLIVGVYASESFSNTDTLIIAGMVVIYLMYLLKSIRDSYVNNDELMALRKAALAHEQELLNQRESAVNANMAKSQLLANMSHDLRTPMHAILGFSELGSKSTKFTPAERLGEYFSSINQSGQRLLRLLDNILDMSKLEAGQMVLNLKSNDIKDVIKKVIEDLMPLFSQRSIEVQIDAAQLNTSAIFDEDRIMQVIHNLLSNAIKFTPDNSCIKVRCYHTNLVRKNNAAVKSVMPLPAVCVSVSDQGSGIPDAELEEVFNKFVQTGKAEAKTSGTGLGLSISKEIIDIHGGTIKAENDSAGGAVFAFVIPQQGPEALENALPMAA